LRRGGGVSKFRLAWRRAEFFPAAAARQGVGWLRWRNSAAEGSTTIVSRIMNSNALNGTDVQNTDL